MWHILNIYLNKPVLYYIGLLIFCLDCSLNKLWPTVVLWASMLLDPWITGGFQNLPVTIPDTVFKTIHKVLSVPVCIRPGIWAKLVLSLVLTNSISAFTASLVLYELRRWVLVHAEGGLLLKRSCPNVVCFIYVVKYCWHTTSIRKNFKWMHYFPLLPSS